MDIKLEDVAKRVGMSKSTVSLALNGSDKVNLETRDRILRVAQEMGYTPQPLCAQARDAQIKHDRPDRARYRERVLRVFGRLHFPGAAQQRVRPVYRHQRKLPASGKSKSCRR